MGFVIFTVFMVCMIATSFVIGLVGIVFDTVRGSSAVRSCPIPQTALSLIGSNVVAPKA